METLLVIIFFAIAVCYLYRRFRRLFDPNQSACSCSGCGGCSAASGQSVKKSTAMKSAKAGRNK